MYNLRGPLSKIDKVVQYCRLWCSLLSNVSLKCLSWVLSTSCLSLFASLTLEASKLDNFIS